MRKVASLALPISLALLAFPALPASAEQPEKRLSSPQSPLDPRLEILRSELAVTERQIEDFQRDRAFRLSSMGTARPRLSNADLYPDRLEGLAERLTALRSDWKALPEAEASELFSSLRGQVRRLHRDVSNSRFALQRLARRGSAFSVTGVTAPGTGAITGTVTEAGSGTPLSGTYIEIYNSSGSYVEAAFTNGSGVYTSATGLDTGDYYVRTYSESGHIDELYDDIQCVGWCTVTTGTPVGVTDGLTTSGIDFALTPGGRISGTVTEDVGFSGISAVYVDIYDSTGRFVTEGYTDGSGNYLSHSGLPTGNYHARTYNGDGYIDELYDDIQCVGNCDKTSGTPIAVTIGIETTGIDFELAEGGLISGSIEDGSTHLPISSAWVSIYDNSGNYVSTEYPDGAGIYTSQTGLPTGTYYARTNNDDGYLNELYDDILCASDCTETDGTPISVTKGATTSSIDFELVKGGAIEGTVTEEGTGTPLDSGFIRIYNASGDYVASSHPDGAGDYKTSAGLVSGTYYALTRSFEGYLHELYDDLPCYFGCTVTDGTPINVTAGSTTSNIDFALAQGGLIAGTVTEDGTSNGLDEGYVGIYDASGDWTIDTYPEANGDYVTYAGLPPGTYYARTWSFEGYFEELYDDIPCSGGCTVTDGTPIVVTAGSTTSNIDFALLEGGSITGTVTEQGTSTKLANIDVNIYDSEGTWVTDGWTDANGDYSSSVGLTTGTYYARTNNSDSYINELYDDLPCAFGCTVTDGTPIAVTIGTTTSGVDFALVMGGTISGTVTADGSGTPLDSGYVRIYDSSSDYLFRAYPNTSGVYETGPGLPSGTYYAKAQSFEGYVTELYDDISCAFGCTATDGTPIAVTGGATTANIDFALDAEASISGAVTDDTTHAGLDTGYLYFYDASGNSLTSVYPDANGDYSFGGLPGGTFYARTFSFEGYYDELYDDIDCSDGCTITDGTPIVVTAGATMSGIDFELTKGGSISGTVTESSGHTGLDTGRVNIYDDNGDWVTRGYPDSSGNYLSQKPLVAGTYYAKSYSFEGYMDELYDNILCVGSCTVTSGTPIVVAASATTSGIDFELDVGGFISGTITDDTSHDPLDTGYVDIYNATGSWVSSAYPNASGDYISNNALSTGSYYARTGSFEGYFDELYDNLPCNDGCTATDGTPIPVTAGLTTSSIDFELAAGGLISGTVTDARTGSPLDFGRVYIYNATGGYVTRGYPDSSGDYTVQKALEAGTYFARTWSFEDYFEELYSEISCALDCTITSGTPISVTLGSETTGIDFTLDRSVFADGFESGNLSSWSATVQ